MSQVQITDRSGVTCIWCDVALARGHGTNCPSAPTSGGHEWSDVRCPMCKAADVDLLSTEGLCATCTDKRDHGRTTDECANCGLTRENGIQPCLEGLEHTYPKPQYCANCWAVDSPNTAEECSSTKSLSGFHLWKDNHPDSGRTMQDRHGPSRPPAVFKTIPVKTTVNIELPTTWHAIVKPMPPLSTSKLAPDRVIMMYAEVDDARDFLEGRLRENVDAPYRIVTLELP